MPARFAALRVLCDASLALFPVVEGLPAREPAAERMRSAMLPTERELMLTMGRLRTVYRVQKTASPSQRADCGLRGAQGHKKGEHASPANTVRTGQKTMSRGGGL